MKKETQKRYFPCWVCKGKGTWIEPVTDEGYGPTESCGYCDGEGMIEIGGERHKEIAAERVALMILKYRPDAKEEWTYQELQDFGKRAIATNLKI